MRRWWWWREGMQSPSFCASRGRALKFKQVLLLHARTEAALFGGFCPLLFLWWGGVDLLSSLSILPSVHPLTRFRSEPLATLDEFAAWQTGTRLPGGGVDPRCTRSIKTKNSHNNIHTLAIETEKKRAARVGMWPLCSTPTVNSWIHLHPRVESKKR